MEKLYTHNAEAMMQPANRGLLSQHSFRGSSAARLQSSPARWSSIPAANPTIMYQQPKNPNRKYRQPAKHHHMNWSRTRPGFTAATDAGSLNMNAHLKTPPLSSANKNWRQWKNIFLLSENYVLIFHSRRLKGHEN